MKPTICILQKQTHFDKPSLIESSSVKEKFDVVKDYFYNIPNKTDIVYTQTYFDRKILEILEEWRGRIVIHVGGNLWNESKGVGLIKQVVDIMNRSQTIVVCNGHGIFDIVKKNLNDNANVMCLPGGLWGTDNSRYGIQPDRFIPKDDYSLKNKKRPSVVMSINLTVERKWAGIFLFLSSIKKIVRKMKIKITCAGMIKSNHDLVKSLSNRYGVRFLEYTEDWPQILQDSDLFIHPSTFDCFPRSVCDAMCTGLPIVAYNMPSTRHVSDKLHFVDPLDHDYVSDSVEWFLSNEDERKQLGEVLLVEALEKTEKHRGDYAGILEDILSST